MGIACFETLPIRQDSNNVSIKDLDIICKRAIACLLSIQLACDISKNSDYNESKQFFFSLLKQYGVENNLIQKEKNYLMETIINKK